MASSPFARKRLPRNQLIPPTRCSAQIEQENSLSELRAGLRENKVMDFLLKSAKISE